MNDFLTIKDIENILHISHNTAYKLINLPGFPKIRIGKSIRIPEEDFHNFIKENIGYKINL